MRVIPLALYEHEQQAFAAGTLTRLVRKTSDIDYVPNVDTIYTYGGVRFRLVKWRCHEGRVVTKTEPSHNEPLTLAQIQGAGLKSAAAFRAWKASWEPNDWSPSVWLATLERIEQE